MATAPRPTSESRDEIAARREAQTRIFRFAVGDAEYRLAPFNMPIGEKLVVQRETGMPWEDVIRPLIEGHISSASLAVLVWLARRASGETRLAWDVFATEWDADAIGDQVTLEVDGPDGDDPEA